MVIIALPCFDDLHLQACMQIKPSILAPCCQGCFTKLQGARSDSCIHRLAGIALMKAEPMQSFLSQSKISCSTQSAQGHKLYENQATGFACTLKVLENYSRCWNFGANFIQPSKGRETFITKLLMLWKN